jgi:hypothetical protein
MKRHHWRTVLERRKRRRKELQHALHLQWEEEERQYLEQQAKRLNRLDYGRANRVAAR